MNDYKSILERESQGGDKIYLYNEGERWVGYEKSAFKLGKLIDDLKPQCHFIDNAIWLAKVEVDYDKLPHEHIVHSSDDECILDVPFLM